MYKHILIPIAFDPGYEDLDPFPIARALAGPDTRFSLIHVIEEVPTYALSYLPDDYRNETRDAVRAAMTEMSAALPNADVWVVDGHAGRTVLDWSEEHGVDLIVIASHHPGLGDYLIGSTTARVVRHAQCSVHVLR